MKEKDYLKNAKQALDGVGDYIDEVLNETTMTTQQLLNDLKHISKERMLNRRTEKQADESMLKVIESYVKEHAIEFAEDAFKKAGYPKDLQPYIGLPGMYKKWNSPK